MSATGSPRISSAQPAAVPGPGFHPNCLGPSFFKIFHLFFNDQGLSKPQEKLGARDGPAAFSSSPVGHPGWDFHTSSSATIRALVQSLMEPSHNEPLNHTPAHLSSNFGARDQPSPAPSALLVNLDSNIGAPGQPSPTTSVLPVKPRRQLRRSQSTFASNFGAPGQSNFACLRQQLRRSWSTFARNLGAPGQSSPATSALPTNLCQQLRPSHSTFASNFGAPSQPSQATSALPVNVRQKLRRSW